jgi:hypothetical protein
VVAGSTARRLGNLRPEHGAELTRRLHAVTVPRLQTLLRPVNPAELSETGWVAVIPSARLIAEFIDKMLVGSKLLVLEKLGDFFENDERLLELLLEHCVPPIQLATPGCFSAFRLDGEGQGFLYGYNLGASNLSWFLAPKDLFGMDPSSILCTLMPEAFAKLERIAEVLELPLALGDLG